MPTASKDQHDLVYIEDYKKNGNKGPFPKYKRLTIIPAGTKNAKTLISIK